MPLTTFTSLTIRNYRIYFSGQALSLSGAWMQRVAQAWLVLDVTGSGTAVGTVTAIQFLPLLLLAPVGGLVADRFDKRRILFVTQTIAAIAAAALGVVVLTGVFELWMVYVTALVGGLAAAFDTPARQTFVLEMVGKEHITNAVSLNTTLVNGARIVGPSLAGILIVTIGTGWAFVFNAVSYLSLIAALLLMNRDELTPAQRAPRGRGQFVGGFRYVATTPSVRTPLILLAVAGTFAYNYQIILPLLARFVFDSGAQVYGLMSSAMGVGAVVGGLVAASRRNRPPVALGRAGLIFGTLAIATSLMPTLWTAIAALVCLGASSVTFIALGNATVQIASAPQMRGRVMGFYVVAFMGTTPVGAPLMGWVGEQFGGRWAMGIGGLTVVIAALWALPRLRELGEEPPPEEVLPVIEEKGQAVEGLGPDKA